MTGNVIYKSKDFYGELQSKFTVEIYDREQSVGVSPIPEITLDSKGFDISYPVSGMADITNPVLASEATVFLLVTNQDLRTFLQSLVEVDENRYILIIKKDDDVFWRGYLEYNGQSFPDQYYPYPYSLKANDGIGRMTHLDYHDQMIPSPKTDRLENFIDIFFNLFEKADIPDLFTNEENYISIITKWECSNINLDGDNVFDHAQIHEFVHQNLEGGLESKSCFDVLKVILEKYNLRILMSKGRYLIEQINIKLDTDYPVFNYKKNRSALHTDNDEKYIVDDYIQLSGATFTFHPSVRKAKHKYLFRNYADQNLFPDDIMAPDIAHELSIDTDEFNDIEFTGGSLDDLFLRFSSQLNLFYDGSAIVNEPVPTRETCFFCVFVKIRSGRYVLVQKDGELSWESDPDDNVNIHNTIRIPDNESFYTRGEDSTKARQINVGLETPVLRSLTDITFEWTTELIRFSGLIIEPTNLIFYGAVFNYSGRGFHLNPLITRGPKFLFQRNYEAINTLPSSTDPIKVSDEVELLDTHFGDGPSVWSSGAIFNNNVIKTTMWRPKSAMVYKPILYQTLIEYLAARKKPIIINSARIYTGYDPVYGIINDGKEYIFLSGTFSASEEIWNCRLATFTLDRTNIHLPGTSFPEVIQPVNPNLNVRSDRNIQKQAYERKYYEDHQRDEVLIMRWDPSEAATDIDLTPHYVINIDMNENSIHMIAVDSDHIKIKLLNPRGRKAYTAEIVMTAAESKDIPEFVDDQENEIDPLFAQTTAPSTFGAGDILFFELRNLSSDDNNYDYMLIRAHLKQ